MNYSRTPSISSFHGLREFIIDKRKVDIVSVYINVHRTEASVQDRT